MLVLDRRSRIVLLVGLPASGKSTWASQQSACTLSSDEIRRVLADDATDQTIHRAVFATLRYLLRRRLELGRPVTYVDATNLTRRERRAYIKLGVLYDARVEAVFFNTPPEVCRERNRQRSRVVPEEALDAMIARLQAPTLDEGFDAVAVLDTSSKPIVGFQTT